LSDIIDEVLVHASAFSTPNAMSAPYEVELIAERNDGHRPPLTRHGTDLFPAVSLDVVDESVAHRVAVLTDKIFKRIKFTLMGGQPHMV
jgi:hypothetical protein